MRPPCRRRVRHSEATATNNSVIKRASSQRARNQLPKPAGVKGRPNSVIKKVKCPDGVAVMLASSSECSGIRANARGRDGRTQTTT